VSAMIHEAGASKSYSGCPILRAFCERWDTTAVDVRFSNPIGMPVEIRGIPPFAKSAKDGAPGAWLLGKSVRRTVSLKKEVEIHEGVSPVIAEIGPVLRVGNVVVHLERVVVVGDIPDG
jgi:hypothetical protein